MSRHREALTENNSSVSQTARQFTFLDEKTAKAQTELQSAFLEDAVLVCEGFESSQDSAELIGQTDHLIASFDETVHQVVFSASGQSHVVSDYFKD